MKNLLTIYYTLEWRDIVILLLLLIIIILLCSIGSLLEYKKKNGFHTETSTSDGDFSCDHYFYIDGERCASSTWNRECPNSLNAFKEEIKEKLKKK